MKKLLFVLSLACFIFACSKTDQDLTTPQVDALSEEFDNSNFGNYKGVFTTLDSETRATVDVSITPDGAAATLTTESGQIYEFYSMAEIIQGESTNVRFEGNEGSFNFEVDGDGENVAITEVVYLNKPSDILIKKNTAKAPATPVTGTYNCNNCEEDQAADEHPHFIDNSVTETFSFIFTGSPGSQDIETQITYVSNVYTDVNAGTEGTENASLGNIITADPDPSDGILTISGMSTVIANVDWEGTHTFLGSSSISGFWDFETGGYVMTGVFQGSEGMLSLPFAENFDQTAAGITGPCGASPFSCGAVNIPANGQWFIEGDASGLTAQLDRVGVISKRLSFRDNDNEICFKTKVIDISSASSVNLSVDFLGDNENDDTDDYADVNLIVDGTSSMIPNWMSFGSASHTLVGNFDGGANAGTATVTSNGITGNTLQIQICAVTNEDGEQINIDNISVVETP